MEKQNLCIQTKEEYKQDTKKAIFYHIEEVKKAKIDYIRNIARAKEEYKKAMDRAKEEKDRAKKKLLSVKAELKDINTAYSSWVLRIREEKEEYNIIENQDSLEIIEKKS